MLKNLLYVFKLKPKSTIISILWELLHGMFIAAPNGFLLLILWEIFSESPNQQKIVNYIITMGTMLVVQFFVASKTMVATNKLTYELSTELRIRLGNHLQKLSMGYFKKRDPGDVASVVLQDVANFETIFGHSIANIFGAVFSTIILSIFLFSLDWRLAIILICALPVGALFVAVANYLLNKSGKKQIEARNNVSNRFLEYILGIRHIKAFNLVGSKFETLEESFDRLRKASIKSEALPGPFVMLAAIVLEICFLIMTGMAIIYFQDGSLTIPVFVAFLIIGYRLYEPIKIMMVDYLMIRYMNLSLIRIIDILEAEPQSKGKDLVPEKYDLSFENVTFSYIEDVHVLKNISFHVPEKSMLALVGPSGSGKTTITFLINRFWDANEGKVKIGGLDVKDMNPETVYGLISEVFQDVYLFDDSIYNNIKIAKPDATDEEIISAATEAQCMEFIDQLEQGIHTGTGEGGSRLSGGQKQRISIARALLKDAPIVLLDEATASLDPENEIYIQKAIEKLVKDKTVVVVAHKLQTVKNSEQVLVLEKGILNEIGVHEQLLKNKNGLYSKLWNLQKQSTEWTVS